MLNSAAKENLKMEGTDPATASASGTAAMKPADFLPCQPIYEVLLRTQGERGQGCAHLEACAGCFGAQRKDLWDPATGRIPRSFAGALRSLEDVKLVIVQGEPSKPETEGGEIRERFDPMSSPQERLDRAAWYSLAKLIDADSYGGIDYHRNLARFVADCFRGADGTAPPMKELLAKTWITASVLCIIPGNATDKVPDAVAIRCAEQYLLRELALFATHRPVLVAMGKSKASQRLRLLGIEGFVETWHPGKPAAIRQHKDDERTACLACNLARAARQVRDQLRSGSTWRVRSGSVAARVLSDGTTTWENRVG